MTITEAKEALDAIDCSDPECAHSEADQILLVLAPASVREAYNRVMDRCDWWAYA